MALTRCHECKSEISTLAKACPQCGAPSKAMAFSQGMQALGCIITLVITVPVVLMAMCAK